ncbi:aminoacyltransferase [Streptococcus merionis]|uniref:Aminoacyltransferase FemA n=1 Tax=Streptococcus merionis TaxID=400065 RepID=A0A239SS27_9STRE|nr:aminoacyltransferase [Streptococcus merionis]SNU88217.1 peptidoglycan branched peptide synthesis protein, alanine adding enzyme [Streptococcus merionis]
MPLKEIDAKTFGAFAQHCPSGSFMQSPEMAKLLPKRGFETTFLGLEKDGQLQVAGLVYTMPMTGGLHMEINSGPLSLDTQYLKEFYQALQTYAKKAGALQLLVKPYETYQTFDSNGQATGTEQEHFITDLTNLGYIHDGLTTGYPGGEPDWHYVKDLSGLTEDSLLASFSKKGRPLVKKALSFGIKTRTLERHELPLFKDITAATSERRDYEDKSLDYYQDFYDSFGDKAEFRVATLHFTDYLTHLKSDREQLLARLKTTEEAILATGSAKQKNLAKELSSQVATFDTRIEEAQSFVDRFGDDEVILAGALFIYDRHETAYLFSGSYPEFNRFYAPAILQLEAMKETLKHQIPTYNFLGITGLFDGSDSVLRFKQNFNGYITRKMGTFRYYPSPLKFKVISLIKKVLGR